MPATWDMVTRGASAGQLVRPLQYTANDDETTRVNVYLKLATPLGAYLHRTNEGLDFERMLDSGTSDEERAALVRDLVLDEPRVLEVLDGPDVTVEDTDQGPRLSVQVTFRTETATITIGG